jgi:hypothetical protein
MKCVALTVLLSQQSSSSHQGYGGTDLMQSGCFIDIASHGVALKSCIFIHANRPEGQILHEIVCITWFIGDL